MSSNSISTQAVPSLNGKVQSPLTGLGVPQLAASQNVDIDRAVSGQVKFQDRMWEFAEIQKDRWNRAFPYQFAIYRRQTSTDGQTTYVQDRVIPPFVLPIPPEALTIQMPFATVTTATLGGIVEENNGAPFRIISIQGTTGVLPLRGNVNSQALNLQTSIIAGTLNAAQGLQQNAQAFAGTVTNRNVVSQGELAQGGNEGTGYYQWKLLERFFEAYAAFKKTREGRGFILGLEIWKDDNIFLVSPIAFTTTRSAASPLEYQYAIQLKAWRRVKPTAAGPTAFRHEPVVRDPNSLARCLNALEAGRRVLQSAKAVLKGVRADINNVLFTPLRESILFGKDILGVVVTAVDLPSNIITDLKDPLLEFVGTGSALDATGAKIKAFPTEVETAFRNLSIQVSKAEVGSGQINVARSGLGTASPASKIADNPDDNFEFFENVKPGLLDLKPATQRKIDDERRRVRLLKREDFEAYRDGFIDVLTDFEAAVGASSATYDRIYQTNNRPSTRVPTESDFEVIFALNQIITEANRLAASSTINRNEINTMEFFAGLATRSGIAFQVPKSKFLVPFPYGYTLEMLANQYLGDPDRWQEIAALNGLQDPYVDEVGFSLSLLTNGNGNTVTVADASQLYVNQPVWISSTTTSRTKRRITAIESLSPTLHIVSVSGDQNLDLYTISASAQLQAFLPNTINSQMSVYIPSDEDVDDDDFRQKSIPGVDYFDPLVRVGGIDLLLTPQGDLVVTPDGDSRLAVGLTNIVQKVRLALDTPRGSLLHHPDYGFPIQVGSSTADISAQDMLAVCRDLFKEDPTFTGVESAAILKDGPLAKIALSVGIAGTQQVIPITVEMPR